MQETKNIKLTTLLIGVVILTTITFIVLRVVSDPTDSEDFPKQLPEVYPFAPRTSNYYLSNPSFSLDENSVLVIDYGERYNKIGKVHNIYKNYT